MFAQMVAANAMRELNLDELDAVNGGCVGVCGGGCGVCPVTITITNCSAVWYDSNGANQKCKTVKH